MQILEVNPTTNRSAIFANVRKCTTDDLNGDEVNNHVLSEGAEGTPGTVHCGDYGLLECDAV
jgi:hypothetical protein